VGCCANFMSILWNQALVRKLLLPMGTRLRQRN
jgi:hypothetical protein